MFLVLIRSNGLLSGGNELLIHSNVYDWCINSFERFVNLWNESLIRTNELLICRNEFRCIVVYHY